MDDDSLGEPLNDWIPINSSLDEAKIFYDKDSFHQGVLNELDEVAKSINKKYEFLLY